jgi:hypothetical protein
VRARLEHAERLRRMGQEAYERAQQAGLNHQLNPQKPWEWVWGELTEVITTSTRSMPSQPSQAARPSKRARGPDIREHKVGEDGNYTHNRRGVELCRMFQPGECTEKDARGYCAKNGNRRHQCSKCLSELHGAQQCQSEEPKQPRDNHGKKGRGKGKK